MMKTSYGNGPQFSQGLLRTKFNKPISPQIGMILNRKILSFVLS